MISESHAEAMRAGRAAQVEADAAARKLAHEMYSAWVREDARLWRAYIGAKDHDKARSAWAANARLMPSISWAPNA